MSRPLGRSSGAQAITPDVYLWSNASVSATAPPAEHPRVRAAQLDVQGAALRHRQAIAQPVGAPRLGGPEADPRRPDQPAADREPIAELRIQPAAGGDAALGHPCHRLLAPECLGAAVGLSAPRRRHPRRQPQRRLRRRVESVYPTWSGCTRSGLFCYSTSTAMDPEQLFVVSDSPATASTHAP